MSKTVPSKKELLGMTLSELTAALTEGGFEGYRAKQVRHWALERMAESFDDMKNIPKALREWLAQNFTLTPLTVERQTTAKDGTIKFLFQLERGGSIESVLMATQPHWSLCVSSQVGCVLDCGFCATATMGFKRNLSAAEIIAQVLYARRVLQREKGELLTHLVFMGMGEPLVNFTNLARALEILTAEDGLNMSQRRITVSTAGYIPGMRQLAASQLNVSLAVSLNAPTQTQREKIMPAVARKFPLKELMDVCRQYPLQNRRRITFEYVMLDGVNTTDEHAHGVARILRGLKSKINLIPFNEHPALPYKRPSLETINRFGAILRDHNYTVTVRWSKGADISAACGQLAAQPQAASASAAAGSAASTAD